MISPVICSLVLVTIVRGNFLGGPNSGDPFGGIPVGPQHEPLNPHDPFGPQPNPNDPFGQQQLPVDPFGPPSTNTFGGPAPLHDNIPLTTLEKCSGATPFKGNFICDDQKILQKMSYADINTKLEMDMSGLDIPYQKDIDDCSVEVARPAISDELEAIRKENKQIVEFVEMCRPVHTPIEFVWSKSQPRRPCFVINNKNLRQSLSYVKCIDPLNDRSDQCRMDYSSMKNFRCVQSGFIKKRITVYCPDESPNGGFGETHTYQVPTACSCRKCGHCQGVEGDNLWVNTFENAFSNLDSFF